MAPSLGGDEVFGGYSWYVTEYRSWRKRRQRAAWTRNNRWFRTLGRFLPALRPIDLERLVEQSGREPGELVGALLELELAQHVERLPGNRYQRLR